MRSSCPSSESPPSQHSGTSTSTTSSAAKLLAASNDATQAAAYEKRFSGLSATDAQRPLITLTPPSTVSVHRSDDPQKQPPRSAVMADSRSAILSVSEENQVGVPPRLLSLPSAQATSASALLSPSLPCQPRGVSGVPPIHNATVEDQAANASASSFSGKIAHVSSSGPRDFAVMLNHKRVIVSSEYPFLIPRNLFAPRAETTVAEEGWCAAGPNEVGGCLVAAEGAGSSPLHCYGNRPVLLLDCTGALRQRRLRRQRRQELQSRASKLAAARADLLRTKNLWSMRRSRARRQKKEMRVPASVVGVAGGGASRDGGDSVAPAPAPSGATEDGDPTADLLSELSRQCKAITHEMKEIRRELLALLQEKWKQAATRDGCVLMLPSPETGEVQLFPGHHYHTVCFVGDELCEVVPGGTRYTGVATSHNCQHRTPPQRELASEGVARELCENDERGLEGEHTSAKVTKRPLWAMAELLGYVLYVRQCRRNPHFRSRRGTTLDSDSIDHQECQQGCVDFDKVAATISYDMVDQYLALPACEMAMYREWAIDKVQLMPQQ